MGGNNRRSKLLVKMLLHHHCALRKFHVTDVKTRVIRLQVIVGPDVHDQGVFCAFHTFLVVVQTNTGYMRATHA